MGVKDDVVRMASRAGLRQRVAELEAEVQECRTLNLRIAELADVVVELLVPLADSDDPRVAEVVERYRASLHDPTQGGPRA